MKITFAGKPKTTTDLYLLAVTQGSLKKLQGPHAKTAKALIDANPEFLGEAGDIVTTVLPGSKFTRFGLIGLGKGERTQLSLERIGGKLTSTLITLPITDVFVDTDGLTPDELAALGSGAAMRAYEFRLYKTKNKDDILPDSVTFGTASPSQCAKAFAPLDAAREAVHWTRDMVNEPPNVLHTEDMAARIVKKLKPLGVKITVLDDKKIKALGMGAITAVGQAAEYKPRLVILEYNGTSGKTSRPVGMVGKGVTFDSGGYSIKTAEGMLEMKADMAGAAAVAGAIMTLAKNKAKVHVVAALALVENMISDEAYRPSDIIKSMSGQTIEITNTDAEGRLILCDAMWYLQKTYKPTTVIDIATLTGAALVALGEEYAAVFANDDALCAALEKASKVTGDKIWRMPLDRVFNAQMDSSVADMRNAGPRFGGTCTAAAFLQRFVLPDVKWAHIDMAPTMGTKTEQALCPVGPTGFGVRLLANWAVNQK